MDCEHLIYVFANRNNTKFAVGFTDLNTKSECRCYEELMAVNFYVA